MPTVPPFAPIWTGFAGPLSTMWSGLPRDLLASLGYAHERGIMHRDVKPDNVILSPEGAMLLDFGIAKAIEAAGTERLTKSGFTVGTSSYMSPEQVAALDTTDHRSDLYSLGCVLFESLAGHPPFMHRSEAMVLQMQLTASPPDVRTHRPGDAAGPGRSTDESDGKRSRRSAGSGPMTCGRRCRRRTLSVRNPDVLDLGRLTQELLPFPFISIQPVPRLPVVHPGSLHVSRGKTLDLFAALGGAEIPDPVDIVMRGEHPGQLIMGFQSRC